MAIKMSLLVLAALFSMPVRGQTVLDVDGEYQGRGGTNILFMRTLVIDSSREKGATGSIETGIVAARIHTSKPGRCVGQFSGIGKFYDSTLRLRPINATSGAADCVISVIFDRSGKTATIKQDRCTYYHGAECDFEGDLSKQNR